jgi:hypothetical protein
VSGLPWLAPLRDGGETTAPADAEAAYEDWYLLEDYAALGVLNEAAVGRGHRTAHDAVARRLGSGSGGLYALLEGDRSELGVSEGLLGVQTPAIWIARPPGSPRRVLAELLGDGMDPRHASLWQRQLVLGPAPEYCLLALEPPRGVAPTRLPSGWSAAVLDRTVLWSGGCG